MDILIKNMEMPKACITGELPNFLYCPCFDSCTIACGDAERPKNCQLIELPPHGRLIDEEDLRNRAYAIQRRDGISFPEALALALTYAPTILEANYE